MSRVLEQLRNYRKVALRVKEIVLGIDPEAEVYVFGSVVRGKFTAASDIDILVVTRRINQKYSMMVEVYRQVDAPIELHIATPEQVKKWFKRFIPAGELIKI